MSDQLETGAFAGLVVAHIALTAVVTFLVSSLIWQPPNIVLEILMVAAVWLAVGAVMVSVSPGYRRRMVPSRSSRS